MNEQLWWDLWEFPIDEVDERVLRDLFNDPDFLEPDSHLEYYDDENFGYGG